MGGESELGLNGWEISRDLRNPSVAMQAAISPFEEACDGHTPLTGSPAHVNSTAMSQGCQGGGCELD